MHLISRIEKRSSGRYQILLEGEDSFPLYYKELRQYGIEEGGVLTEQSYQEIMSVFSSGVAYTLQILAQKDSNPTIVALLLSLESVFGAVSGAIFLHETMTGKELVGCVLMLIAVVLAQIEFPSKKKAKSA